MSRTPLRTVRVRPLVCYAALIVMDHDGEYGRSGPARAVDGTGLLRLWDEGFLLLSHGNDFHPFVEMNLWPAAAPVPDTGWDVSGPHGIRVTSGRLKARDLLEWGDCEPLALPPGGYLARVSRRGTPWPRTEVGAFTHDDVLEEWTLDLWPGADDEVPPPVRRRRGRLPASARERTAPGA